MIKITKPENKDNFIVFRTGEHIGFLAKSKKGYVEAYCLTEALSVGNKWVLENISYSASSIAGAFWIEHIEVLSRNQFITLFLDKIDLKSRYDKAEFYTNFDHNKVYMKFNTMLKTMYLDIANINDISSSLHKYSNANMLVISKKEAKEILGVT